MQSTEPEIRAVEEARRRSAQRVRSLLEELEAAEREFEALTEKFKTLSATLAPEKASTSISTST